MNKQQLDKIRKYAKADLTQVGRVGKYLDQLEEYLDAYRKDVPELLDYIEELKEMLSLSSGACYTAAKTYAVTFNMQKKKIEELEKKLKEII